MKMKKRLISLFITLFPLGITFLASRTDLLSSNLSGLYPGRYYYVLMLLVIFAGFIFFIAYKTIINTFWAALVLSAFFLSVILPYKADDAWLLNLHILNGYLSFTLLTSSIFKGISTFYIEDHRLFTRLFNIFLLLMGFIVITFIYFMGVNGLMEIIYLSIISFITLIMYVKKAQ